MCKWIMNMEAMQYMTFQRVTFDTYKIIAPRNVLLGGNYAVEAIKMNLIIVEILLRDKIEKIHIKDALYVSKLQANLISKNNLMSNNLI